MTTGADLAALRAEEFPWSAERIYLNSAGTGPLPVRTQLVLDDWTLRRAQPDTIPDQELFDTLTRARRLAARLLNARPEEIACSTNTSYGLNLAAAGLPLEAGDVVLFPAREFPANAYPWLALERRGVVVEQVPATPEGWPDEDRIVERVADPRVKLLAVSHVQFSNGFAVDLARLSRATRASGTLLVVDGIQAVGNRPIDLAATPVDVLSCGAQKWLLSPWGAGFTYVRRELQERLRPVMAGWMAYEGTDDFTRLTDYGRTLHDDARRYELVTLPYHDLAAMNASLGLLLDVGVDAIARHIAECHAPLLAWAERRGVRVTSPRGTHGSAILCLAPPDPARSHAHLRRAGAWCVVREGSLRISPHLFNTVDELERVSELLDASLQT